MVKEDLTAFIDNNESHVVSRVNLGISEIAQPIPDGFGHTGRIFSVDPIAPGEALNHPGETPRTPYVTEKLSPSNGPVIAVSDYMRAVPLQIARWVPDDYRVLGADGFGFADTRPAARRFFQIDAESVVVQALQALADAGEIDGALAKKAFDTYRIDDPTATKGILQEGGDA